MYCLMWYTPHRLRVRQWSAFRLALGRAAAATQPESGCREQLGPASLGHAPRLLPNKGAVGSPRGRQLNVIQNVRGEPDSVLCFLLSLLLVFWEYGKGNNRETFCRIKSSHLMVDNPNILPWEGCFAFGARGHWADWPPFCYCSSRLQKLCAVWGTVIWVGQWHTLKCTFQAEVVSLTGKTGSKVFLMGAAPYLCLVKNAFTKILKTWSWLMKSEKQHRKWADTFIYGTLQKQILFMHQLL